MDKDKKYFLDNPSNIKLLLKLFYALCALIFLADFFVPKHGHFYWENVPQFFGAYGLVGCIVLVFAAKYALRPIVKRKEDYYD